MTVSVAKGRAVDITYFDFSDAFDTVFDILTECWMSSEEDWKLHGQAQRVVIS